MAAEEITETYIGGTVGAGSSLSGTAIIWGLYQVTCTEDGDWVLLPEFEKIKSVFPLVNTSGAIRSSTATDVITFSATAITFTTGGAETYDLFVAGTPAIAD